jgi:hypothetical protein
MGLYQFYGPELLMGRVSRLVENGAVVDFGAIPDSGSSTLAQAALSYNLRI